MTLDWQVLVIAFIALSLRLLAVSPGLHGVEIDGQLKGRTTVGMTRSKSRQRAIDNFQSH
jgi:hypothetical protein